MFGLVFYFRPSTKICQAKVFLFNSKNFQAEHFRPKSSTVEVPLFTLKRSKGREKVLKELIKLLYLYNYVSWYLNMIETLDLPSFETLGRDIVTKYGVLSFVAITLISTGGQSSSSLENYDFYRYQISL